jgi:hypothetical protein
MICGVQAMEKHEKEENDKKFTELKYERKSVVCFSGLNDNDSNSLYSNAYSLFNNFHQKVEEQRKARDESSMPGWYEIQGEYVTSESAYALLSLMGTIVKNETKENKQGESIFIPERMIFNMTPYDDTVIAAFRKQEIDKHKEELEKLKKSHADELGRLNKDYQRVVATNNYLNRRGTNLYIQGILHTVLATGATAGLGYGAWWYFTRNK